MAVGAARIGRSNATNTRIGTQVALMAYPSAVTGHSESNYHLLGAAHRLALAPRAVHHHGRRGEAINHHDGDLVGTVHVAGTS